MSSIRLAAAAAVLTLSSLASAQQEDYAEFIERGMELWHAPGTAAAVVSDEEILFQQGFGTTSIEDGSPIDEHTVFAIA